MSYPLTVYKQQMLLAFDVVEDVKPHTCILQHIIFMAGVTAKWQMVLAFVSVEEWIIDHYV